MFSQTDEIAGDAHEHGATGKGLAARVQKFDGKTTADEIVTILRDLVNAIATAEIKKSEAADIVGIVADKTGLPANALKEVHQHGWLFRLQRFREQWRPIGDDHVRAGAAEALHQLVRTGGAR